jgi:hypothetical protein
MTDPEKQAMIDKMVAGELCIKALSENEFYGLLSGLTRMYFARVWNCCDASGRMDHEWSALSDIFQRVCEEREKVVTAVRSAHEMVVERETGE